MSSECIYSRENSKNRNRVTSRKNRVLYNTYMKWRRHVMIEIKTYTRKQQLYTLNKKKKKKRLKRLAIIQKTTKLISRCFTRFCILRFYIDTIFLIPLLVYTLRIRVYL